MGMKQIQALPYGRKLNSHISIHVLKHTCYLCNVSKEKKKKNVRNNLFPQHPKKTIRIYFVRQ